MIEKLKKSKKNKFDYLLENHLLTEKELNRAITIAYGSTKKEPVETVLIREFCILKKDIGESLSKYYSVPFIEFNKNMPIPDELLTKLKAAFLRENFWVPLRLENEEIVIAIDNPYDIQKIDGIRIIFAGRKVRFNVALKEDILDFIELFIGDSTSVDKILAQLQDKDDWPDERESAIDDTNLDAASIIKKMITKAGVLGASHIHIEQIPAKKSTFAWIRVDGVWKLEYSFPLHITTTLIDHIKSISNSEGIIRFTEADGKAVEFRAVTIPTLQGQEEVILRNCGNIKW